MEAYWTAVWGVLQGRLLVLALLTILDLIFGVGVSLVKKDFKLEYLMHYLTTDVLPIFAWVGVVLITLIPSELIPAGTTLPFVGDVVYATVFLSILASILGSFSSIGILTTLLSKVGIGEIKPPVDPVQ